MFGGRAGLSNSTFYTNLDSDTEDGESGGLKAVVEPEAEAEDGCQGTNNASLKRAAVLDGSNPTVSSEEGDDEGGRDERRRRAHRSTPDGFSRLRQYLVTPVDGSVDRIEDDEQQEHSMRTQFAKVPHGVLEYRSSRYVASERSSRQYTVDAYAVSESESEEESEGRKSSESDFAVVADPSDSVTVESRSDAKKHSEDLKRRKARRVAEELLATEKNYVNVLRLIDQVFQFRVDQENRAHPMFPPETVQHMFSNIKSIYKFHNDFLLPQLEERMQAWQSNPRIGDIMKNFAPFLKMYTEYVKNFDYAMNLINSLQSKLARFAAIVNDIQKLEECGKLSLAHHMLSPIQRLPRYELLLKDYLKNLAEDNPDREDAIKALELVSTAANHTNEAMKKIDKFKKLLEIQESIYDATDLVSATRELVKEGRIVKISARSGDHQDRHLFLFSDILLLCSIRLIPGPLYRLRAKFMVENLQVIEGDNLETANTFYIRDEDKSVELYTHSAEEKAAWLEALFETMQEIVKRKASLKTSNVKAVVVKTEDVSRCMVCEVIFSVMKRKHNCRACGIVVCGKCSSQKLLFEDNKNMRVCRLCHAALTQPLTNSPSSPSGAMPPPSSLLQVSACASSVLSGYLLLKTQASKPWIRRWFALHVDFVLYSFKSESEIMAMTATPMPGFKLTEGTKLSDEDALHTRDRPRAFKMHHSKKSYYLQAATQKDKEKWIHALRLATKAELPRFASPTETEETEECQLAEAHLR